MLSIYHAMGKNFAAQTVEKAYYLRETNGEHRNNKIVCFKLLGDKLNWDFPRTEDLTGKTGKCFYQLTTAQGKLQV